MPNDYIRQFFLQAYVYKLIDFMNINKQKIYVAVIVIMLIGSILYFMIMPIISIRRIIDQNEEVMDDDVDIASYIHKKTNYDFYPNKFPKNKSEGNHGHMEIRAPGIWGEDNYHKIGLICDITPKCIAYDTIGNLYSNTQPLINWKHVFNSDAGTYVSSAYKVPYV